MSSYYIGSLFLRHDTEALEEYVRSLPTLQQGLRGIMDGDDDTIVVTRELQETMLRLRTLHRDIGLPVFQRIWNVVVDDLDKVAGMRRSEVLGLLQRDDWSAPLRPDRLRFQD
jgi:hypothetical protein